MPTNAECGRRSTGSPPTSARPASRGTRKPAVAGLRRLLPPLHADACCRFSRGVTRKSMRGCGRGGPVCRPIDTSPSRRASARHRAQPSRLVDGPRECGDNCGAAMRALFQRTSTVICPVDPTPAYHTDHSPEQETGRITSTQGLWPTPTRWHGPASPTCPAARDRDSDRPFARRAANRRAIVGPWLGGSHAAKTRRN